MDDHVKLWTEKRINEMSFPEREAAVTNILREKGAIYDTYIGCAERIIKALFLMNSGGVVTILAYLHGFKEAGAVKNEYWINLSLCVFLTGLVSAFILVACDYLIVNRGFTKYSSHTRKFLRNEISFSEIDWFKNDEISCYQRFISFIFLYFTGALAFASAIAGIAFGLIGYFNP